MFWSGASLTRPERIGAIVAADGVVGADFDLASSAIRCRFVDRFVRLNVLSRVSRHIAKGSGKMLHEFARENLGMGATEWATGRDGEPFAAFGARMSVRDLSRIGMMMLHGDKMGERTVVPADWVTRCVTPVIGADEDRRYGYPWFVLDIAFDKPKGWMVGQPGAHVDGAGRRRPTVIHHARTALVRMKP